jgi:hypothetical protein
MFQGKNLDFTGDKNPYGLIQNGGLKSKKSKKSKKLRKSKKSKKTRKTRKTRKSRKHSFINIF